MSTERDQLYADIFTTACEGGINYWAGIDAYCWRMPDGTEDLMDFCAEIECSDRPDEHGQHLYLIDRSVIDRGYKKACVEFSHYGWSTTPPPVRVDEDTDWDYDAGDADMIVQIGLFGDVVFG